MNQERMDEAYHAMRLLTEGERAMSTIRAEQDAGTFAGEARAAAGEPEQAARG